MDPNQAQQPGGVAGQPQKEDYGDKGKMVLLTRFYLLSLYDPGPESSEK